MKPQNHASSYYAATANDHTEYPALQEDITVDVCVVGGGFSGVATALTLAERGLSVALLEANKIGWGASGRNGGQLLAGWSGESALIKQVGEDAEKFLWRTRYRGNDIAEERMEKYQIQCDYVKGAVTAAVNASQMKMLQKEYVDCVENGYRDEMQMVGADGIRDYVGTDKYVGGLIDNRGGHLHPLNLCLGEARAAHSLGVKIFEKSPVTGIQHGPIATVITDGGKVKAKFVVLAGNAYHKLERKKLHGYMLPTETYVIATEQLDADLAAEILPKNSAVCDANIVLDYYRLSSENRLIFGGGCNYLNVSNMDPEKELLPRLHALFPQLSDVKIGYSWSGVMGIPLNRVPMIGRIADNAFYVQGYSGHGVNCSHIAGELLADAIELRDQDIKLFEQVSHFHIPAADYIGNPMLALGMLYYRMKDSLGISEH